MAVQSATTIEDTFRVIQRDHPSGLLIALDFRKAFDSVRWSLILETLRWFNFGENFVDLVTTMFVDIQSCVANSGFSSQFFSSSKGIRQGCCASPYLFNLVVEVLATMIRVNPGIGSQFADNLTSFLSDAKDLPALLETLNTFDQWSGLQINRSKSAILCPSLLGAGITSLFNIPVVQRIKILGIWLNSEDSVETSYWWNFKDLLACIRGICNSWANRHLSLKGKITIANSLLVSILQYPCSFIYVLQRVYKEYQQIVSNFIWNGRKPKIAYNTLTQSTQLGGLNLIDLRTRTTVNLIQWSRRLILHPEMNTVSAMSSSDPRILTFSSPLSKLDSMLIFSRYGRGSAVLNLRVNR